MNHSQLFERLLLDLQRLINSDDKYDLIESSRVIRQLLLDGDALLHLVNREIRASVQFNIRKNKHHFDFNPNIYPNEYTDDIITYNLQCFLSHPLGLSDGKPVTVREIIKYVATALGGVHFKKEDSKGEYAHISKIHNSRGEHVKSDVLLALKYIGAITCDALIPIRDRILIRERFETGFGWTALLSIRLLPAPPDEENYVLDVGSDEQANRFSIYVDPRGELTFRIIDAGGDRRYLRTGRVGQAVPLGSHIIILCELSTVDSECLLSIRTDGWNHAEIAQAASLQQIGNPLHFVIGSDCLGRKHTHMDIFGMLLIARPLTGLEISQTVAYFATKVAESMPYINCSGNQFLHSEKHPNFVNGSV